MLPPELYNEIISHLHTSIPSLCACALTSHSFLPESQKHLFYRIRVTIPDPSRTPEFLTLLSKQNADGKHYIRDYIRGIRIYSVAPSISDSGFRRTLNAIIEALCPSTPSSAEESRLTFFAYRNTHIRRREIPCLPALITLFASPQLHAVSLGGQLSIPPLTSLLGLFSGASGLARLSIEDGRFYTDSDDWGGRRWEWGWESRSTADAVNTIGTGTGVAIARTPYSPYAVALGLRHLTLSIDKLPETDRDELTRMDWTRLRSLRLVGRNSSWHGLNDIKWRGLKLGNALEELSVEVWGRTNTYRITSPTGFSHVLTPCTSLRLLSISLEDYVPHTPPQDAVTWLSGIINAVPLCAPIRTNANINANTTPNVHLSTGTMASVSESESESESATRTCTGEPNTRPRLSIRIGVVMSPESSLMKRLFVKETWAWLGNRKLDVRIVFGCRPLPDERVIEELGRAFPEGVWPEFVSE